MNTKIPLTKHHIINLIGYVLESEETHFQEYVNELHHADFDVSDNQQLDIALNNPAIIHIYKTAKLIQRELEG